ncbi:MAG TPA: hypothetical protein VLV48_09895, partial [Thermoanaerobaculia bacterium]|nr:hypothetical protein [Thermoanaerobaculia bacterium]
MLFDLKATASGNGPGAVRQELAAVGEVRTPGIADLFVAVLGGNGRPRRPNSEDPSRDRLRRSVSEDEGEAR